MTLQEALYPEDVGRPVGIDIAGMEFDRGFGASRHRPFRGATAESVAAEDMKLNKQRAMVAAMGEYWK